MASALSKEIPWQADVVIGVVALGAGLGSFFLIRHAIKKSKEARDAKKAAEANANLINTEAEQWQAAGQTLTMPLLQYNALADQIETAVNGPFYDPTDEDSIYSALSKLGNNRDFLQLVSAYGARDGYTLQSAIQGDMDPEERQKCNQILQSKGITYTV